MEQEQTNMAEGADGAPRPRRVAVGTPGMFWLVSEPAAPCTCLSASLETCGVALWLRRQGSHALAAILRAASTSGNDDEGPTASAAAAVTAACVAAASMCFTYAVVGALRRHVIMHR